MNVKLTKEKLFTSCFVLTPDDYKTSFGECIKIKHWIDKHSKAFAIAANQIGITKQMFIVHRKYKKFGLPTDIYFNPIFVPETDEKVIFGEGCLSYPGITFEIVRYKKIKLCYYNPREKNTFTVILDGLASIICQHEITHLHGIDEQSLDQSILLQEFMYTNKIDDIHIGRIEFLKNKENKNE